MSIQQYVNELLQLIHYYTRNIKLIYFFFVKRISFTTFDEKLLSDRNFLINVNQH